VEREATGERAARQADRPSSRATVARCSTAPLTGSRPSSCSPSRRPPAAGPPTETTPRADGGSTDSDASSLDSSGADSSTDATESTGPAGPPQVAFETTLGTIVLELDPIAAPITTANFLTYVDGGFFEGADGNGATIFHRVIPGFVVQGGGLTESLEQKATLPPIVNESGNGLLNVRGAISMARTDDPDSATSQFFLNLVDNDFLDDPPGYAVFGSVIEGLEVVDAMAAVATTTMGPYEDVPVEPIVVLSVTRM
jgi:peptidyl-prolyl cis-trans isomerase A (cyclophilin A)